MQYTRMAIYIRLLNSLVRMSFLSLVIHGNFLRYELSMFYKP